MSEWQTIQEFFNTFASEKYVVLRNYENLCLALKNEAHSDIDILCEDRDRVIELTQLESRSKNPNDLIHRRALIGGVNVDVDLRCVGDGYYDEKWERSILERRVYWNNLCFAPNEEDYFFSLLYHALIQKQTMSSEYEQRLTKMGTGLGIDYPVSIQTLEAYMHEKGYYYTYPEYIGAVFNTSKADKKLIKSDPKRKVKRFLARIKRKIRRNK